MQNVFGILSTKDGSMKIRPKKDSTENEIVGTGWLFQIIGSFQVGVAISRITECQSYSEYTFVLAYLLVGIFVLGIGMLFLIVFHQP